MSTRFYPRFVKGNPQLRIFLPDWKLVMIKPKDKLPENIVSFRTDPRMTDWDIKNYLEKIYKVPVAYINSKIHAGDLKRKIGTLTKDEDYKIVNVTLPLGTTFKWPDLYPDKKIQKEKEDLAAMKEELDKVKKQDTDSVKGPSWFN